MANKIGDRIKELRSKAGYTQAELAEKVGFQPQTVSNWESGTREPDIQALIKLAEIFKVSLDYLLQGKTDDDRISLDDMDVEKRLARIIERDDVNNFKKYDYVTSAYVFGRTRNMNHAFRNGYNYQVDMVALNVPTWKEIISKGAKQILNTCLDEFLKRNNKNGYWSTFAVFDFLDDFVKAVIDLDRDDVLLAIGIQYFAIKGNRIASIEKTDPMLIGPSNNYNDRRAYGIEKETLDYFFTKEKESPRCFKLIATLSLQDITPQLRQSRIDKKEYVLTFLEYSLLEKAVELKKYDLVKDYMTSFENEIKHIKTMLDEVRANRNGIIYNLVESFVTNSQSYDGPHVYGRLFKYPQTVIDSLIIGGKVELAKEMLSQNKEIAYFIKTFFRSSPNDQNIYLLTDSEIERMVKLNSSELNEDEKTRLNCIQDYLVIPNALINTNNLKLAKELLDKYYLTYYEFAYRALTSNDVKEFYKFLIDNEFNDLAHILLRGPEHYSELLHECWEWFRIDTNTAEFRAHEKLLRKQVHVEYPTRDEHGDFLEIRDESNKLTDNIIINAIQNKKDSIYKCIEDNIAAAKKKKAEAEERAKIVKGLTRDYFEDLLEKEEEELFIIKLCAYFDAILRFDYHFDGEDFSSRMNQYFAQLESNLPKSRDKDDGWGYMVLDEEYENEVVIPEREKFKHKKDLFNRLRIQRNNIAHSETKKVEELMLGELEECLDLIMPKKGEK